MIIATWAQLFKTNNVVSYHDVKISNILYIKTLPFFAEKMWGAKAPHIFSAKNISTLDFRRTRRLNESLTNDFIKLPMLWTTGPRILDYFFQCFKEPPRNG